MPDLLFIDRPSPVLIDGVPRGRVPKEYIFKRELIFWMSLESHWESSQVRGTMMIQFHAFQSTYHCLSPWIRQSHIEQDIYLSMAPSTQPSKKMFRSNDENSAQFHSGVHSLVPEMTSNGRRKSPSKCSSRTSSLSHCVHWYARGLGHLASLPEQQFDGCVRSDGQGYYTWDRRHLNQSTTRARLYPT